MDTRHATAAPGSARTRWEPKPSLPGPAYFADDTYEQEKESLFHAGWFCIGRDEQLPVAGNFFTADVAGESVISTRTKQGELRAFYNVCRHRGTRLCDGEGIAKSAVFKCPYHAWTYALDGRLVGAPNVHEEEGFDKSQFSLWGLAIDTWDGFVFVNMAEDPVPLRESLAQDPHFPLAYERYGTADLRVGARLDYEVAANWKIIIDNYNECLHCPTVHPELIQIVPIYRKGRVEEREDWDGVNLSEGSTSFTLTGKSKLPRLPGISDEDAHTYYGTLVFPNLLMNYLSDCVFGILLLPRGPEHTRVLVEFMFRPETIAAPDFDPSEIVEFVDLVGRQDWEICERAQRGVHSRAFRSGGVYPYNDRLLHEFNSYYLERMGDR